MNVLIGINLDPFSCLRNRESYGQCRDHGERLGKMKHNISLKMMCMDTPRHQGAR